MLMLNIINAWVKIQKSKKLSDLNNVYNLNKFKTNIQFSNLLTFFIQDLTFLKSKQLKFHSNLNFIITLVFSFLFLFTIISIILFLI